MEIKLEISEKNRNRNRKIRKNTRLDVVMRFDFCRKNPIGAAKGNTLLNSLRIKKNVIKFVAENNIKKINKYTPGTHIKIVNDKNFIKNKIHYAILLSWNYKKFFLSNSLFKKEGGKFIIPLPIPHIK